MARAHFVKRARKCPRRGSGIYKGDSYWWWQFKSRVKGVRLPKQLSKTPPKRSQLTRSPFYKTVYDLEDSAKTVRTLEEAAQYIESTKEALEQLKAECEESLEAMPESLRETSSTGKLLTERIEGIEAWIDGLSGLDLDAEIPEELTEDDEIDDYGVSISDHLVNCCPGL